jgi:hypothetical protein
VGSTDDHSARLALAATAFIAKQRTRKGNSQIASAAAGWASEQPGMVHAVTSMANRGFKLANGFRLAGQFMPNRCAHG